MTVQELINKLQEIEDKSQIAIYNLNGDYPIKIEAVMIQDDGNVELI